MRKIFLFIFLSSWLAGGAYAEERLTEQYCTPS